MRRLSCSTAMLTLVVTLDGGCGNSSAEKPGEPGASGSTAPAKYRIAVIPKGTTHEFWKSIHAGARKAEQELGDVEVIWKGPAKENDRAQQISVVETFGQGTVDAIVLAPLDKESLVPPVEMAMNNGIPVVIIDSGLASEDVTSYIATDNYNGGVIGARYLGKQLDGKGNVVLLRYMKGSASTEQREKGFLDTIKKEFPEVNILSDDQYAGDTREDALQMAENLVNLYGDKVDGWFCPCEPVTFGVHRALEQKGLAGKVKVVGFDAVPELVEALRQGEIDGLILQDPVNMGYLGVKTAYAKLKGRPVEDKVSTGEHLITKGNMDEPENKRLHSPDLSKWLSAR